MAKNAITLEVIEAILVKITDKLTESINSTQFAIHLISPDLSKLSAISERLDNIEKHITVHPVYADCSILLKFYTEFEHMTPERPQKFKDKGSKVKVSSHLADGLHDNNNLRCQNASR